MTLSPHLLDLLSRYPLDLSDAELAELRAAAEADPRLEAALHEALELDATIAGLPHTTPDLSESGQRRLDLLLKTTKAWGSSPAAPLEASAAPTTPGPENPADTTKAWGSSPAAPLEAKARPDNVVSLFSRRPVQLALAALLLIAVGLGVRTLSDDPYNGGIKGDDDDATLDRQLILQPPGAARLDDGAAQPIDAPIRITARLKNARSLALLEVQGDTSAVLWPVPDGVWLGAVGPNLLQPPGASPDYRPAAAGAATYVLIGGESPLHVPSRLMTEADLLAANPGATVLDRRSILWTAPPESP